MHTQKSQRQRSVRAILAALLLSSGIPAAADESGAEHTAATRQVSAELLQALGSKLKAQLEKGDPAAAIRVCRDIAPEAANNLSRRNGWRVTRVGTRVRNPMLGMPDTWEQSVLISFADRAAQGETLADMEYADVVEEQDGRYFRYMKAIGVKPMCLMCHGSPDQIPEPVKAVLKTDYPHDAAINYKAGELRGAVSIKQPLQPDN